MKYRLVIFPVLAILIGWLTGTVSANGHENSIESAIQNTIGTRTPLIAVVGLQYRALGLMDPYKIRLLGLNGENVGLATEDFPFYPIHTDNSGNLRFLTFGGENTLVIKEFNFPGYKCTSQPTNLAYPTGRDETRVLVYSPNGTYSADLRLDNCTLIDQNSGDEITNQFNGEVPWSGIDDPAWFYGMYKIKLTYDGSYLYALDCDYQLPVQNLWRYEFSTNRWTILTTMTGITDFYIYQNTDYIALSLRYFTTLILSSDTGEVIHTIPDSTSPAMGTEWAGCLQIKPDVRFVLFDMTDDWKRHEIEIDWSRFAGPSFPSHLTIMEPWTTAR